MQNVEFEPVWIKTCHSSCDRKRKTNLQNTPKRWKMESRTPVMKIHSSLCFPGRERRGSGYNPQLQSRAREGQGGCRWESSCCLICVSFFQTALRDTDNRLVCLCCWCCCCWRRLWCQYRTPVAIGGCLCLRREPFWTIDLDPKNEKGHFFSRLIFAFCVKILTPN